MEDLQQIDTAFEFRSAMNSANVEPPLLDASYHTIDVVETDSAVVSGAFTQFDDNTRNKTSFFELLEVSIE